MFELAELYSGKEDCCGCTMCVDVCPRDVLAIRKDALGFGYPEVVNAARCIDCKLCIRSCPVRNVGRITRQVTDVYAGYYLDNAETLRSASGGFAAAVSERVVGQGGVVYGVRYSADQKGAEYARVDRKDALPALRSSKYIQSEKDHIYRLVRQDLQEGRMVLFTGLPCEVAAVQERFGKHEKLYTVELMCHGPTSPDAQKQYIEQMEEKAHAGIVSFTTRFKKNGSWRPYYVRAEFQNGAVHQEQFLYSPMGTAFAYLKPPACFSCRFKGENSIGDIMIGDYHYGEKGMRGYNRYGASVILVKSRKGRALVQMLGADFQLCEISQRAGLANGAIHRPTPRPEGWERYQQMFAKEGLRKANRIPSVRLSCRYKRVKRKATEIGVAVKRCLVPSTRPNERS